jgi:hypothetical protein
MWHVWRRREGHGFWWENLVQRDDMEDFGVDGGGGVILK